MIDPLLATLVFAAALVTVVLGVRLGSTELTIGAVVAIGACTLAVHDGTREPPLR